LSSYYNVTILFEVSANHKGFLTIYDTKVVVHGQIALNPFGVPNTRVPLVALLNVPSFNLCEMKMDV
jgi:hypothetical protein